MNFVMHLRLGVSFDIVNTRFPLKLEAGMRFVRRTKEWHEGPLHKKLESRYNYHLYTFSGFLFRHLDTPDTRVWTGNL